MHINWILLAIAVAVVIWLMIRRRKPAHPQTSPKSTGAAPSAARDAETIEAQVKKPTLPEGVEHAIVAALRRGDDPDETWIEAASSSGELVRLAPWSARFQSVAGESFANPDGVSRQAILENATIGTIVWLVPEPSNRHDQDAVIVALDGADGSAAQIGYLPRGHGLGGDIASGSVAAWLARVGSRRKGAPLGALLYLVIRQV